MIQMLDIIRYETFNSDTIPGKGRYIPPPKVVSLVCFFANNALQFCFVVLLLSVIEIFNISTLF